MMRPRPNERCPFRAQAFYEADGEREAGQHSRRQRNQQNSQLPFAQPELCLKVRKPRNQSAKRNGNGKLGEKGAMMGLHVVDPRLLHCRLQCAGAAGCSFDTASPLHLSTYGVHRLQTRPSSRNNIRSSPGVPHLPCSPCPQRLLPLEGGGRPTPFLNSGNR